MRRNDLQLVPPVDEESTPVDLAEILLASPDAPPPLLRVLPPSDENDTPDDAA